MLGLVMAAPVSAQWHRHQAGSRWQPYVASTNWVRPAPVPSPASIEHPIATSRRAVTPPQDLGGEVIAVSYQQHVPQRPVDIRKPVPTPRPLPIGPLERLDPPTDFAVEQHFPSVPANFEPTPQFSAQPSYKPAFPQPFEIPPAVDAGGVVIDPAVEPGVEPIHDYSMDEPYPVEPWVDPLQPHWYFKAEYLLWWTQDDRIPPLATTSTNPVDLGIIGRPTTQVLFGNDPLQRDPYSGARFTFGWWLDCEEAIELRGFFLGRENDRFNAQASQFPVISRPFFSANRDGEFVELVNFPNLVAGNLTVETPSTFGGLEANLRCNLCSKKSCCESRTFRVDLFGGPRWLNLDESVTITEDIIGLPTASDPFLRNQQITVVDRFATSNNFYGGQIGLDAECRRNRWGLNMRAQLAIGGTHQNIDIQGSQRFVDLTNGTIQNFNGGLLALPSNIGSHSRGQFSVVPEFDLSLSYYLRERLRLSVGYNILWWTNVVRPGGQIDRILDERQIPNFRPGEQATTLPAGELRPIVPFKNTDFWAQGLNIGLELRY